jgi:ELWxxDGT repeat protein
MLRAEALEDRFLPSLTPNLLLDINPGAGDSSPRQFTQVNNQVFFTSIDGAHGRELWVSNGTAASTALVKDINPGGTGSYPTNLTNLNGTLFFTANDGTHGVQLWESNGTAAGTFLFDDINPGVANGGPYSLTNVNGSLFFAANDGTGRAELFSSNGVAAGTAEFLHMNPGAISPGSLTNVNATLFFTFNDGVHGNQLWESNGTNAGTFALPAFGPTYLTNVNGTLFFRAGDNLHHDLWESNGTAAGTFLVKDINPGTSSYPYYLTNANGTLFFSANDGTHGFELWESNGTAAGTVLVADINPGSASSAPRYLMNVNGTVFFQANDGTHGSELWESNGSAAGTFLVADIIPGAASGYPEHLANGNGTLFFQANDGTHGFELWASNGGAAGTFLVADINPGGSGSYPANLAGANGALFFAANDGTHGVEPWILIPSSTSVSSSPNPAGFGQTVIFTATVTAGLGLTPTGTVDFKEGSTDLTPGGVSLTAGQATFSTNSLTLGSHTITAVYVSDGDFSGSQGDDSASPQVVHKAAGTPTVTSSLDPVGLGQAVTFTATVTHEGSVPPTGTVDFKEGSTDLTPGGVSLTAGQATFSTSSLALGSHTITAFYSGDGNFTTGQGNNSANPEIVSATALEPRLLKDLGPFSQGPFAGFTQVNNLVFFPADDGVHGTELWASDGTTAGTFLVADINKGRLGSYPTYLTNVNGTLFFAARAGGITEVFESDGTDAGTFPVAPFAPDKIAVNPHSLANVNGTLFFDAADQVNQNGVLTNQRGLWTSDGTDAGTSLVDDIYPGNDPKISYLTNVNGTLFFAANDGTHGSQLWESDGTAAGTFRVTDGGGPFGLNPQSLTNLNGTLFFSTMGQGQLWESNGTNAGTFPLPAFGSKYLTNVNGTLFFSAVDNTGTELWESNGTAAGTFLVADINPGMNGSYPTNLTNVNGTVFFSADDGTHAPELWESSGTAAGTSLVKLGVVVFEHSSLTNLNGTLFFSGDDGTHGSQLWASNGIAAGTFMVQDVNPAEYPFVPYSLTNANGALFFVADNGNGVGPWILIPSSAPVSSSPNPAAFGQPVTFTATVGNALGLTATGTVDFKEGSTDLTPGGVSLVGGQATFSTSTLDLGSHTITALYSGDSNFSAIDGSDSAHPEIVHKDSTSVTLLISPSTLVSGQLVAIEAVVANTSGPFGLPSGQVQFAVDGTNLGPPQSVLFGVASHLPTKLLAAGSPHTITATYTDSGGNFVGSSTSVTRAVAKDGTKTILASTPTTAVSGQVVVFTATVIAQTPGSGTPTGSVDFKEGATDLTPGGVTMAGGKATFSTSSLALGTHTLTAAYSGDVNFTGSSGNDASAPVVVNKASTRTVMTSFPDPSVFGQVVSFTVAVIALAPSQGTPTGTVVFTDGTATIGTVTLNNVGRATFTTSSLSRGNHAINANYGGDAKFKVSSDTNFGETVLKDATTATVTASANPAVVGTTITFTAALQASSPGTGTPTGTVTFLDITTTLGTGTLNAAGKATFTTSTLALGTHAILASYAGDTNFVSSFSPSMSEVVKASVRAALATPLAAAHSDPRASLLLDINPGSANSYPASFTQVDNLVFFSAFDPTHGDGRVLWASDGTSAGTFVVQDSGSIGFYPKYLTNVNGTLFFRAGDSSHGVELWESDGTAAGTFLVKDINPGAGNAYPKYLTNVNGTLFFQANDGTHGVELWESNGSAAGTFLVADINPGAGNAYPKYLTNVNGTLFFQANDGTHGKQLWESNGRAAGTFLVKDINGTSNSGPYDPTNVNGTLFFAAVDGTHGVELWESNGTVAGTFLVKDINPGSSNSYPKYLTNVNGTLFFDANDGTHGVELWESNGSAAGTFLAKDINPGTANSYPKYLTNVNGTLFFQAFDPTNGPVLWASDGTSAGTFVVQDSGSIGFNPKYLTNVNGTLFFRAGDSSHGAELWESDGSAAGTFLVKDINPGSSGSYPEYLANVNGALFFSANDGVHGSEPWVLGGPRARAAFTIHGLLDINPGPANSVPKFFTQVNNLTFFQADDGIHGAELWASNGTAAGTFLVDDIRPGGGGSYPYYLTNLNGTLFFQVNSTLWESNGSAAGTFEVLDPGKNIVFPGYMTNVNGTLFFDASDGTHGVELFRSDGTQAGTMMVKDINAGPGNSYPQRLSNVNGTLFFSADDGSHGRELWESNGTAAGTFLVKDINPGSNSSSPRYLTNVNGTLFFNADDGTHGLQLWESNGSAVGTFLVKDINGTSNSGPYGPTNVNGTLFFGAFDAAHGAELWESNGTAAGTFLVKDINPAAGNSYPKYLTNVNGTLFFNADDGTHGRELWESNGSAAGTFLVKDINPSTISGRNGSYPTYLTNVNGTLFFQANDGAHGRELWESNGNGSRLGTFLVDDIYPGTSDSKPGGLTNVNGDLFFSADDGDHGIEPWILVSTATTTSVSSTPNPSVFGQAAIFTATIGVSPGNSAPTGTVDFKEGSTDLTPGGVSLVGGQATFSIGTLAVGSHTITALYGGDSTFSGSQGDDSANPEVVQKDSTSIVLARTVTVSGQPLAFAAVVLNTSGPFGTPTGQVQFTVDGTNLGPPVTLVGGVAGSLPTRLFAAGSPHTIAATYTNSDGNFVGSSGSFTQGVAKAGTRTVLISTPTTAVSGQVVNFTAVVNPVAPGSGTPTGTVDFKEGTTDLTPGGVSLSAGRAFFSTSSLGLGSHTITASYSGDANFTASSGNDVNSLVVNQASTRTVMTSFPDPSVFGQVVSFTVAVIALAPSQGTPTGTVTFTDGATTIGSVTLNNVGRATFTTSSLSRGSHSINVNYGGDAKFKVSSDMGFGETVQKDATTPTVTASPNPAVVGTTVTFTATLQASSPGAGTPTGTVTFLDIATTLGTGTLNAAGKATFTTSALALGTHAISASYAGDNNFLASASLPLAETVKSSVAVSSALAFSAMRPTDPVSGTASTQATPQAQAVNGTTLAESGAAAPSAATLNPSQLDSYFAAVTTGSAARRFAQLATPRRDPADWLDDPFLFTN